MLIPQAWQVQKRISFSVKASVLLGCIRRQKKAYPRQGWFYANRAYRCDSCNRNFGLSNAAAFYGLYGQRKEKRDDFRYKKLCHRSGGTDCGRKRGYTNQWESLVGKLGGTFSPAPVKSLDEGARASDTREGVQNSDNPSGGDFYVYKNGKQQAMLRHI